MWVTDTRSICSVYDWHPTKVNIVCPVGLPPKRCMDGPAVEMRCGVEGCSWTCRGTREAAYSHARLRHPGRGAHLHLPGGRAAIDEARRERRRALEREKKRRARLKVSRGSCQDGAASAREPNGRAATAGHCVC